MVEMAGGQPGAGAVVEGEKEDSGARQAAAAGEKEVMEKAGSWSGVRQDLRTCPDRAAVG